MFDKVFSRLTPHRIDHNIYPFAARQFDRRNEVCVDRYQNDLIHLPFVRKGSHVDSKAHVDTLLNDV